MRRSFFFGTAVLLALAGGCGGDDAPTPTVDAGNTDLGGDVDMGGDVADGGDVDMGGDVIDGGNVDGGACVPTVTDTTHIRDACSPDGGMCPAGYECFGFSGAILSFSCEIACTSDCNCASPTTCAIVTDKAGDHTFCRTP